MLNFLQLSNVVEDYRWERSAGVSITKWLTVKNCEFVPFFSIDRLIFCWTLLQELCLKNRFGNEASSPYPRKHFFLGKTFDACMLLAHKLEDLGMFTYNSLQAAYYLSPFLHLSFFCLICNNLCLEGSSQQQVEGGSFFKMFKGWVSSIKNRIWPKSYFFWCVFWGKVMITCSYPLLLTLALPICCYLFFTSRVWPLRFWSFTNPWLTQVIWYSSGNLAPSYGKVSEWSLFRPAKLYVHGASVNIGQLKRSSVLTMT